MTEPAALDPDARRVSARLVAAEIAVFTTLLLLAFWEVWRLFPTDADLRWLRGVFIGGAVIVVGVALLNPRQRLDEVGLAPRRFTDGWASVIVFTAACLIGLLVVTAIEDSWLFASKRTWWAVKYIPGVVAQQFAMQAFINNRLFFATGRAGVSIVVGTLVMVALHAPNIALCAGVAVSTPFWIWHFRRFHNLPALVVSHLVLGIGAMFLLGKPLLVNLRVGISALDLMLKH
ncbi:MAG: hypothetical protein GC159_18025 [Phycisphaera sp.]|nr:hypothetical protein [Phycisphaera sp.]